MTQRSSFLTAAGVALALARGAASLHATETRLTYLTFSAPVALPGVTLPSGSYAFELADPLGASNIVLVRNRARTQVYFLGFTNRVARPRSMRDTSAVTFGEAAPGQALPIAAWYPPDGGDGRQFIYR
jgi:hypothetical protein